MEYKAAGMLQVYWLYDRERRRIADTLAHLGRRKLQIGDDRVRLDVWVKFTMKLAA